MKKPLILIILLALAALCNAQNSSREVPPDGKPLTAPVTAKIKPSVVLSEPEIVGIASQLDTVLYLIQRSDMAKQERNNSADRLQLVRVYILQKLQAVKQDSVKKGGGAK